MTSEELLNTLDPYQAAAVTCPLNRTKMLCMASAGSGKTRMLVSRIAFWIQKGVPASSFMMLTFTNRAAREMEQRITALTGHIPGESGTFHSVACRCLRRYGPLIGLDRRFIILDADMARELMHVCFASFYDCFPSRKKDFSLDEKEVLDAWSLTRGCCCEFQEAAARVTDRDSARFRMDADLARRVIVEEYERRKHEGGMLDFDDLLTGFDALLDRQDFRLHILMEHPNIFVDEYQDISPLQDRIIEKLASGRNCSLTAVGDDAQCIYGFRGSSIEFIRNFQQEYPGSLVMTLPVSWRSSPGIVRCAEKIINAGPMRKVIVPARKEGPEPLFRTERDEWSQGRFIAETAMMLHADPEHPVPWNRMAVLVRTRRQGRAVERTMKVLVPLRMECGKDLFDRAHIRLCTAFLTLNAFPGNEPAFTRLFLCAKGLGKKKTEVLYRKYMDTGADFEAMPAPEQPDAALLRDLLIRARDLPPAEQLRLFLDSWLTPERAADLWPKDSDARIPDLDALPEMAEQSGCRTAEEFLDAMALSPEIPGAPDRRGEDGIVITTIHRAKGLEWDTVFLPAVNQGILPLKGENLEEERRVLYVAVTRARERLWLIRQADRRNYDGGGKWDGSWSELLPEELLKTKRSTPSAPLTLAQYWNAY